MNTREKKSIDEREWRKLCDLALAESDPKRLSELLDRLLKDLDVRKQTPNTTEK
jgi:hypothetical protein